MSRMPLVIVTFVQLFVLIMNALILARVIASFVANPHGRVNQGLAGVTEPILAPVRRVMPQTAGLDLSPWVAILALQAVEYFITASLS